MPTHVCTHKHSVYEAPSTSFDELMFGWLAFAMQDLKLLQEDHSVSRQSVFGFCVALYFCAFHGSNLHGLELPGFLLL